MNDHQRLITVWRLELKARVVKGELKRWQSSIQDRVNTIHQEKTSIHQADIRYDALSEQLQRWDVDLETLARRVKLVEEGIQKGHFQDLDQTQSQIVEYTTKADQIETEYLETLEIQERLRFSQALSRDKIKYTQQALSSTTEQYEVVRLDGETQLDVIFQETERLLEQMNPKVSSLYRLMVIKKKTGCRRSGGWCLWRMFLKSTHRTVVDGGSSLNDLSLSQLQCIFDSRRYRDLMFRHLCSLE